MAGNAASLFRVSTWRLWLVVAHFCIVVGFANLIVVVSLLFGNLVAVFLLILRLRLSLLKGVSDYMFVLALASSVFRQVFFHH